MDIQDYSGLGKVVSIAPCVRIIKRNTQTNQTSSFLPSFPMKWSYSNLHISEFGKHFSTGKWFFHYFSFTVCFFFFPLRKSFGFNSQKHILDKTRVWTGFLYEISHVNLWHENFQKWKEEGIFTELFYFTSQVFLQQISFSPSLNTLVSTVEHIHIFLMGMSTSAVQAPGWSQRSSKGKHLLKSVQAWMSGFQIKCFAWQDCSKCTTLCKYKHSQNLRNILPSFRNL